MADRTSEEERALLPNRLAYLLKLLHLVFTFVASVWRVITKSRTYLLISINCTHNILLLSLLSATLIGDIGIVFVDIFLLGFDIRAGKPESLYSLQMCKYKQYLYDPNLPCPSLQKCLL